MVNSPGKRSRAGDFLKFLNYEFNFLNSYKTTQFIQCHGLFRLSGWGLVVWGLDPFQAVGFINEVGHSISVLSF